MNIFLIYEIISYILKGPYLQYYGNNGIIVLWESSDETSGLVQYGLSYSLGFEASHLELLKFHSILLYPLLNDTIYYYRIISGTDTSEIKYFRSPTYSERFRFFVFGDTRTDSSMHQSVINRMLQELPSPYFILNTGDLTTTGSEVDYQTYFNIERDLLSKTILFPVLGNHDIGNISNWFKYFSLPDNERWYSFHFGNSSFHIIDNYSYFLPESEQYQWLLSEFLSDSANPEIKNIFVLCHEPPFSTNLGHGSNLLIRENLVPLFERFKVKIVFSGHNHCYERSFVNNVQYIISGGGGAPIYNNWDTICYWTMYREAKYHFVVIDVNYDTIISRGIKITGEVFDSFIMIPTAGINEDLTEKIILDIPQTFFPKIHRIHLFMPFDEEVKINIIDITGRKVSKVVDKRLKKGDYFFESENRLKSGVYFIILEAEDFYLIKKFVIIELKK